MRIRILTENVNGLGLGHVARCFNLSVTFLEMGYEIDFFVRGGENFSDFLKVQINSYLDKNEQTIESKKDFTHFLEDSKIDSKNIFKYFYPLALDWENIAHSSLLECEVCIIDSYNISNFDKFIQYSKAICILDDDGRHANLLNKHKNLFILNPNGIYNKLLKDKESNRVFSGLSFALLNKCFIESKGTTDSKKYDFFMCLGGEDKKDISYKIFNKLKSMDFSVCVVVGSNYKGKLLNRIESNNIDSIFHNISQKKLANLMRDCKSCIVSGGGIIFEALSLIKNIYAINLASNQNEQINILKQQKLVNEITLSFKKSDFVEFKKQDSIKIGDKVNEICGTLSIYAINTSLHLKEEKKEKNIKIKLDSKRLEAINFCNLGPREAIQILRYRNHPFVYKSMYGSQNISAKTHFDFIASLHNENHSKYFLVREILRKDAIDIGVINLTRINFRHKHAYLGIYKNPFLYTSSKDSKYTISYGEMLIKMIKHIAFNIYNLHMLYLEVLESNIKAIHLYEKTGFKQCGILNECFKISENNSKNNDKFGNILIYEIKNDNF